MLPIKGLNRLASLGKLAKIRDYRLMMAETVCAHRRAINKHKPGYYESTSMALNRFLRQFSCLLDAAVKGQERRFYDDHFLNATLYPDA